MAALILNASVVANPYPIPHPQLVPFPIQRQIDFVISVTDVLGNPFLNLEESDISIVIVGSSGQAITPQIVYTKTEQAHDSDGNPITVPDPETGADVPVIVSVPGPARTLGLPGFYLMQVILRTSPVGRVAAEIAISMVDFKGQTLVPFEVA